MDKSFSLFSPLGTARRLRQAHAEMIRLLLELSELKVEQLISPERPGDVDNLASRLLRLGMLGLVLRGVGAQTIARQIRTRPAILKPLVREAAKLLAAVADEQHYELPVPRGSKLVLNAQVLKAAEHAITGGPPPVGKSDPTVRFREMMDGTNAPKGALAWRMTTGLNMTVQLTTPKPTQWFPVFLFGAVHALDSQQGMLVRRCRYERCNKIFLATRPDRRYCSHGCASAVGLAKYRESVGEEAFKADHARYMREARSRRRRQPGA